MTSRYGVAFMYICSALQWRQNGDDGVSNHQPHNCLLNRLFGRRSKKISNSASLAFVRGFHRDRWIPRTKGQLRGKCFHLMTSSWIWYIVAISVVIFLMKLPSLECQWHAWPCDISLHILEFPIHCWDICPLLLIRRAICKSKRHTVAWP